MRHPRRQGRKMERARKKWWKKFKAKEVAANTLPPCEWCGSTFRGHYPGCPDLDRFTDMEAYG